MSTELLNQFTTLKSRIEKARMGGVLVLRQSKLSYYRMGWVYIGHLELALVSGSALCRIALWDFRGTLSFLSLVFAKLG